MYSALYENDEESEIHSEFLYRENLSDSSPDSIQEVRWCPDKNDIQNQWSASVAAIVESIADYDPRPYGNAIHEPSKCYWDHRTKSWLPVTVIGCHAFDPVQEVPPDGVAAVGHGLGMDMRPHLYDA